MFIFIWWCNLTGHKWDEDPPTRLHSRPALLALWSVTHHPPLPLPQTLCPTTMATLTAAAPRRIGTDRRMNMAGHTRLTPTGPAAITCCTETSTTHYHQQVCLFSGYMCKHPIVFIIKNISHKENKQNPWLFLTFPLSPHPTPSVAYIRTDRQMFAPKQHGSMPVWMIHTVRSGSVSLSGQLLWYLQESVTSLTWQVLNTVAHDEKKRDPQSQSSPAFRASCLLFLLFLVFRLFQSSGFWTASHHYTTFTCTHAAFVFLTHPKHPLLKIKGLPNSTLSLICWPVAHQSSRYSLPLASC